MEDTAVQNYSLGSTAKQVAILDSTYCEYATFEDCSHRDEVFEGLQSLRENKVLCDIELETNDGTIVFGHKNVLVSASPYFHAMFTRFEESTKDRVIIKKIDSTILKLLIDFIYNGKITVTQENVQVLLPAAKLLQLHYVEGVCCEFLETQLHPSNCLGVKAFAESHSCMELLSSSEAYIKKVFVWEIVLYDEFLSLPFEEVIKIISCEDLNVSSEEKLFECVINWVKHELNCRKDILPKLMEQVRLPLVSKNYILKKVLVEPLLSESSKCKDYVIEALNFHLLKTEPLCNIPQNFRCKPRPGALQKIILTFSYSVDYECYEATWYDPSTDKWHLAPKMNTCCINDESNEFVIKDNFLLSFVSTESVSMMYMIDLSIQSPFWILNIPMLFNRRHFGVGIIDNCIYVVGGSVPVGSSETFNKVEVYDLSIHEWKEVSSMTTKRKMVGVGMLNNFLYAVGGSECSGSRSIIFNSVECYDPSLDTWSNIAEMSQRRNGVGVGVLDGVMYAIGGNNGSKDLKSAEIYRPSDGVWSYISDMHFSRYRPVVIALDGLLYVMGGVKSSSFCVEIYHPNIDSWEVMNYDEFDVTTDHKIYAGVVIDKPPHFETN